MDHHLRIEIVSAVTFTFIFNFLAAVKKHERSLRFARDFGNAV